MAITRYGRDDAVVPAVESMRAVMTQFGDGSPIVVGETGWATDGPPGTGTVGEDGQVMDIKCSLIKLALRRTALNIAGVMYYQWKDALPYSRDFWGLHTGLVRLDGTRKPGYAAFAAAAAELESMPAGNWKPRACFGATDLRPLTGDPVTFSSTSLDPDGTVAAQAWDLRNAGTFADGNGTSASRSFAKAGTYLVRLRVTDAAGVTDVSTQAVAVRNRPPVAAFVRTSTVGTTVTFTSTSSDQDGRIVAQAWDLDDDGAYDDATGSTATRTFPAPGKYTVRLKVTDDDGASRTTWRTITVY
jgi:plastocyanin